MYSPGSNRGQPSSNFATHFFSGKIVDAYGILDAGGTAKCKFLQLGLAFYSVPMWIAMLSIDAVKIGESCLTFWFVKARPKLPILRFRVLD